MRGSVFWPFICEREVLGQRGLRLCQVAGRASVYPLSGMVVSLFVPHEGLVAVSLDLNCYCLFLSVFVKMTLTRASTL